MQSSVTFVTGASLLNHAVTKHLTRILQDILTQDNLKNAVETTMWKPYMSCRIRAQERYGVLHKKIA